MILRHAGTWLESTTTHNTEGMAIKSWSVLKTGPCDIQPANLNENELKLFGITDQKSSVKKIFFEADNAIVEGLRFYDSARTKLYDVRGSNEWDIHHVVLGIPVVGEAYVPVAPTVSHFGPLSGAIGSTATIYGTGFVGVTAVHLGAVDVTAYTVTDSHTISATIPLLSVTGAFSVTASTGTGTSAYNFTVAP
jgi:hypothetical protein